MSIQAELMTKMKEAMKSKDTVALTALRALKSAFMLMKTESGAGELSEAEELKVVQKQVKQRKDSATLFAEQGRDDLAAPELAEAAVLEQFLPEALSADALTAIVKETIAEVGAEGMKDMGKVMGLVTKKVAGQADGKTISSEVKAQLS
ncbi:conserved hypothetical protein [Tenacibaculum litopenaei]|jgi:uncharacterized protein YqeY|uniref:GatB/YqeY domain-containing protein n=1 Tax=Tenacibaculum litopenaei TaxID=396016 RepID=UPI0038951ACE